MKNKQNYVISDDKSSDENVSVINQNATNRNQKSVIDVLGTQPAILRMMVRRFFLASFSDDNDD